MNTMLPSRALHPQCNQIDRIFSVSEFETRAQGRFTWNVIIYAKSQVLRLPNMLLASLRALSTDLLTQCLPLDPNNSRSSTSLRSCCRPDAIVVTVSDTVVLLHHAPLPSSMATEASAAVSEKVLGRLTGVKDGYFLAEARRLKLDIWE